MIETRLMSPGSFDFDLVENFPASIERAILPYDHIVVTANPADVALSNSLLGLSIYTGVVTGKPSPGRVTGQGPEIWLGTSEGAGDVLETAVTSGGAAWTLSQWVTALLPASVTVGTVTNTGTSLNNVYQWVTRREALDDVCRLVGAEWRLNPDMTFDAAAPGTLFVTTPTVVITSKEEGQEGALRGLEGALTNSIDVENYLTAAIVVAAGSGATVATGAATSGATTYRDFYGNPVVMERFVNAPSTPSASAAAAASAALAQFSSARQQLSASSDTYAPTRFAKRGDTVFGYDLASQLIDPTKQVTFRGELIAPAARRVFAMTHPFQRGMGVFLRHSVSAGVYTWTDLTPYIAWESGDTTWEVGAQNAAIDTDVSTFASPAQLGANPAIATRTSTTDLAWTAVTFSGAWVNFGGAYQTAQYRRVGDMVHVRGVVKSGTTGTAIFTLPVGCRPPAGLQFSVPGPSITDDAGIDISSAGVVIGYCVVGTTAFSITCQFSVTA